ncbi:MAG: hypothetical protein IJA69_00850 [Clostridia bacterium]|nr:hypothetical protein [Clostridia bacterium]
MEKTFCCDASCLAWGLYKETNQLSYLSLYLNLEYFDEKTLEIQEEQDMGMEA